MRVINHFYVPHSTLYLSNIHASNIKAAMLSGELFVRLIVFCSKLQFL